MKIGIPREIFEDERRVAATPPSVHKLIGLGYEVMVEAGAGEAAELLAGARMLGLLSNALGEWARGADFGAYEVLLATARDAAMASKDFSEVDRIKGALVAAGVEVRMSKAGVELLPAAGFDAAKLEGLL